MAKLVELLFKDFAATRVIGKSIVVQMGAENPVPAYWETCMNEGIFQVLEALGPSNSAYVGWMGEWNAETETYTYMVGMLFPAWTVVPKGYDYRDLAPCVMGIGYIQGVEPDIYTNAHGLTEEALAESDYAPDYSYGYSMEVYAEERFVQPMQEGKGEAILDYYVPCKKR